MCGAILVEVVSKRQIYKITLQRNITLIRGQSGTGKTALCYAIEQALRGNTAINLSITSEEHQTSKIVVKVLHNEDGWEQIIKNSHNTIFFLDEDCVFVMKSEFSTIVKGSSNYFVLINRHDIVLDQLPISVHEIYELHTSGKYIDTRQVVAHTINTRMWQKNIETMDQVQ